MTCKLWDKASAVNGSEAVDIIGAEQMENDDPFILFSDDTGTVVAIESMSTIKTAYGLEGDDWETVAEAYVAFMAVDLPALQAAKQSENNAALASFLSANPLTYTDGKQYGVTLSDQQELSLNLLQYQLAVSAGATPTLEWHAVHEACTEWTYADLSALSLAIATYVYPYIRQNQALKTRIYATATAAALDAITINYKVTADA